MNTQTIIELNGKLNSKDKQKLQNLLEIVFDIDNTKYYSIESTISDVITNEVMSMKDVR